MPTRNVNLTVELDRLVLAKVATGRYELSLIHIYGGHG